MSAFRERFETSVERVFEGLYALTLATPARRALVESLATIDGVEDLAACERHALLWTAPSLTEEALITAVHAAQARELSTQGERHTLEVVYDGEDLETVAEQRSLSTREVIARHSEREYEVLATGFAPGWAYLGPLDPRLAVARRATPRPRVEARSVAIADLRTGVYPFAGPGGWSLLGSIADDFRPFDPARGAALALGDRVCFRAVDPRSVARRAIHATSADRVPMTHAGPRLIVESMGAPALVQDGGRIGAIRHGVPRGGALWKGGVARANRALAQRWNTAAIELYGAVRLRLAGAPRIDLSHDGRVIVVREGESVTLPRPEHARVTYLAVRGGVACSPQLGGRGQLVRAALGGLDDARDRPIRRGDSILCVGDGPLSFSPQPEPEEPEDERALDEQYVIALRPTRRAADRERFAPRALERFCEGVYSVSPESDRTGMRLRGRVERSIERLGDDRGESAPMAAGAIEVPADGAPIVLGVDHPTVGGYPTIAIVAPRHLGALLARRPGARVRFAIE